MQRALSSPHLEKLLRTERSYLSRAINSKPSVLKSYGCAITAAAVDCCCSLWLAIKHVLVVFSVLNVLLRGLP
jgi:hypothetical protein